MEKGSDALNFPSHFLFPSITRTHLISCIYISRIYFRYIPTLTCHSKCRKEDWWSPSENFFFFHPLLFLVLLVYECLLQQLLSLLVQLFFLFLSLFYSFFSSCTQKMYRVGYGCVRNDSLSHSLSLWMIFIGVVDAYAFLRGR